VMTSRRLCAYAAFFAALFVLMLPVRPVYTVPGGIKIVATGEKNLAALSNEVWIIKESSDMLLQKGVRPTRGWELREGSFLSFREQPAALEVDISFVAGSQLMFVRHPYSGIVDIYSGGEHQRFDLYATSGGPINLSMVDLPGAQLNVGKTVRNALLAYAGGFVFFWMIGLLLGRGMGKRQISDNHDLHLKRVLVYAAPGFVIYLVSLLIYWPAQMSPDSITQWGEMASGSYNDSHPIFSTLLYSLVYRLSPHPQYVVVAQALCFSLVGGFALSEALSWGARRRWVILAALLFPLYPANFLLVSTLWKDVPFGIGVLLISIVAARMVRRQMLVSRSTAVALALIGITILGVRHNGILVVLPFIGLMAWCAKDKRSRLRLVMVMLVQLAAFIALKTVVLTAMNASSIGPHYKAIYALHALGAMQKAGVEFSAQERELLDATLPADEWRTSYECGSVVPLFWSRSISYPFLAENASALNRMALRSILHNPVVFIKHQICLASLVWRITANPQEYMAFAPQTIFDMPKTHELGLKMESKMPDVRKWLNGATIWAWDHCAYLFRAGIYLLLGVFATVLLMGRVGKTAGLIFLPSLLNAGSMVVMTGSQDYRYMWPTVISSMFVLLLAMGGTRFLEDRGGRFRISGEA